MALLTSCNSNFSLEITQTGLFFMNNRWLESYYCFRFLWKEESIFSDNVIDKYYLNHFFSAEWQHDSDGLIDTIANVLETDVAQPWHTDIESLEIAILPTDISDLSDLINFSNTQKREHKQPDDEFTIMCQLNNLAFTGKPSLNYDDGVIFKLVVTRQQIEDLAKELKHDYLEHLNNMYDNEVKPRCNGMSDEDTELLKNIIEQQKANILN